MKGILYKENNEWKVRWYGENSLIGITPLHPIDVKNHGDKLIEYSQVEFDIVPVFVEKEKTLNGECVDGEDVPYAKLISTENILYSSIEDLIIRWNIDGTKTAGSLTRDIMKLISKHITL